MSLPNCGVNALQGEAVRVATSVPSCPVVDTAVRFAGAKEGAPRLARRRVPYQEKGIPGACRAEDQYVMFVTPNARRGSVGAPMLSLPERREPRRPGQPAREPTPKSNEPSSSPSAAHTASSFPTPNLDVNCNNHSHVIAELGCQRSPKGKLRSRAKSASSCRIADTAVRSRRSNWGEPGELAATFIETAVSG